MKWEQYYSHTYNDQGHIKHVLKTSPLPVIDQEGLNQITVTPTALEENEHTQNQALRTSQQKRRVHWNDNLTIHALEPCGAICQRPHYQRPDNAICTCGRNSTPTTWEHNASATASRAARKLRHGQVDFKAKKYRDQLTDVVVTMFQLGIGKNWPNCPPPKNYNKQSPQPEEDDAEPKQDTCLTTNTNHTASNSNINILQRPRLTETSPSPNTPSSSSPKTLQQRQEEYDRARERIFARIASTK